MTGASEGRRPGRGSPGGGGSDSIETVLVALMRGINVGGKHRLPMKDLAEIFAAAGGSEIRTYIQSGNVVFRAQPDLGERIPSRVVRAVSDRFGFDSPVVIRSAAELGRVAAGNPFLRERADPGTLHVVFLADRPSAASVAALDPHRSPPDRFAAGEREIYLQCPNGMARSKLTAQYFDSRLGTVSTVRNWRTVLKLLEMTSELSSGTSG